MTKLDVVPSPPSPPSLRDRIRRAPKWLKIVASIWLVGIVLVAIPSKHKTDSSPNHAAVAPTATAPEETPPRLSTADIEAAPTPAQRARDALGDSISSDIAVGDSAVRSVKQTGQLLDITLTTPEGGFEGPSTDDTDGLASAALAKVYGDAEWHGATYVEFRGGLVDSATGRSLPNAPTVSYRVNGDEARNINWSDAEALFNIDWGIYRAFCHPALKGC